MPKLTTKQKLIHAWGKVRRYYYGIIAQDYVKRSHARREGECARCGACCKLMYRCPYLNEDATPPECTRHETRWKNCRIFPVDEADLAERDIVLPDVPCGYYFRNKRDGRHSR